MSKSPRRPGTKPRVRADKKFITDSIDDMLSPGGSNTRSPKPKVKGKLVDKVSLFDNLNSSGSSMKLSRYELEKQAILDERAGSVHATARKLDDQEAKNEEWYKKILEERRATRARRHRKMKKKQSEKKKSSDCNSNSNSNTKPKKHHSSVFKNRRGATSKKIVDPKTYKAPKKLKTPTMTQKELVIKAMKENVFIHDENNEDLLLAFEPIVVEAGSKFEEVDDGHYYVVEKGQVHVHVNGVKIGTFAEGDTFGDLNLLYNDTDKKNTMLVNGSESEPTQLLRLNQDDMLDILQHKVHKDHQEKRELLKNIPFINKLLKAYEASKKLNATNKDNWEHRVYDVMKPIVFRKGDMLGDEQSGSSDTLYVVKKGSLKITSDDNQEFELGPGEYIGKKALMGTGKEPRITKLEALEDGNLYAIEKKTVTNVLGNNFFPRQTAKLSDQKKLKEFECMKSVNAPDLDVMTQIISEEEFSTKATILKQGDEVEPCLFLVREGEVMLHTNDGSLKHKVKAGGYFGVEQLLIPDELKDPNKPTPTNVKLPAEWNVTVLGDGPCAVGRLSLNECQEILNSGGKIPEEQMKKEQKKMVDMESPIMKKREESRQAIENKLRLEDLERKSVLGDGAFGEVWLVAAEVDKKKQDYALKIINKGNADEMKLVEREIKVTQVLQHPGVVNLVATFRDEESIYLLMGLIRGGELWDQIHRELDDGEWVSGLSESAAKFYAFLITDALAFIHSKQYVYRDLKPENVMIDDDGYPMLVDFGFAKHCPDKTFTSCGTPNYVSPEIVWNKGHNQGVDFWALGVLIYEMVCGEHPFYVDGMDQVAVFNEITTGDYAPVPDTASKDVTNLIGGLLQKEQTERLGMLKGKAKDILNHPWCKELNLKEMRARKVKAPYVPPKKK